MRNGDARASGTGSPRHTVVHLIRHGMPVVGCDARGRPVIYRPDAPLSPEGRSQVAALAGVILAAEPIDVVYTSPYVRAVETAQVLAGIHRAPDPIVRSCLVDTDAPGWFGVPWEEFKRYTPSQVFADPRTRETPQQIDARMRECFSGIVAAESGRTIAVVSHGDPLRILYWRLHHPDEQLPSMDEIGRFLTLHPGDARRVVLGESGSCRDVDA